MGPGVRRDDGRDSKHLKIFAMLPVRHFGLKPLDLDRKSTRLNSSHGYISYAVFCLKKKNRNQHSSLNHDGDHSRHLNRVTPRVPRSLAILHAEPPSLGRTPRQLEGRLSLHSWTDVW